MDWITTSGKTLHEAKSNALDQLGIVADEAEFDIVNDVEKSLFGRVKTEARVRARVRPRPIPEKDERSNRRRNSGNKSNNRNRSRGGGGDTKKNKSNNNGGQKQQKSSTGAASEKQAPANKDGAQSEKKANQNKSGNGRNRNRGGGSQGASAASAAPKKENKAVETEISREDQERIATEFLDGLLGAFEMEGSVAVVQEQADDGAIELTVTGQELGLLVGQKGATLNSLQELTRTVVQRNADGAKTDRLRVDVAGYRARRTAALADFATKIANDVIESGNEKLLEPMGPADRKVVHDTVNAIDGVETGSEGEEPRRRVVIRPV